MMSLEFLITSLVVIVAPGTGVLYTIATGIARGGTGSIAAALGCTLGIVPHIAAAVFGLAALLHASALAFQLLKYAGIAYLLYMAWQALKEGGALKTETRVDARSAREIVATGILINLLNPKLSVFFLAFLPQFIAPGEAHPVPLMFGLSLVFMALTFIVFVGYGLGAAAMRAHVLARPAVVAWMRRAFAGAFLVLGARLALAER